MTSEYTLWPEFVVEIVMELVVELVVELVTELDCAQAGRIENVRTRTIAPLRVNGFMALSSAGSL